MYAGVQQSIEIPITTTVTTRTQSVSSNDQQLHLTPPSKWKTYSWLLYEYIADLFYSRRKQSFVSNAVFTNQA